MIDASARAEGSISLIALSASSAGSCSIQEMYVVSFLAVSQQSSNYVTMPPWDSDRALVELGTALRCYVTGGNASSSHRPYSLIYSLVAEGNGGFRFKLLLSDSSTQEEYDEEIDAFFTFLERYHAADLPSDLIVELEQTRVLGQTILLAFNSSLKRVQPIDPLQKRASGSADLATR